MSEGQVRTGEIKIGQAGHSRLVKLRQVESGQVKAKLGKSGQVKSGAGQSRTGHVWTCQVWTGQFMTGQVRTGPVRTAIKDRLSRDKSSLSSSSHVMLSPSWELSSQDWWSPFKTGQVDLEIFLHPKFLWINKKNWIQIFLFNQNFFEPRFLSKILNQNFFELKIHLRMEFDFCVGPTCYIIDSAAEIFFENFES